MRKVKINKVLKLLTRTLRLLISIQFTIICKTIIHLQLHLQLLLYWNHFAYILQVLFCVELARLYLNVDDTISGDVFFYWSVGVLGSFCKIFALRSVFFGCVENGAHLSLMSSSWSSIVWNLALFLSWFTRYFGCLGRNVLTIHLIRIPTVILNVGSLFCIHNHRFAILFLQNWLLACTEVFDEFAIFVEFAMVITLSRPQDRLKLLRLHLIQLASTWRLRFILRKPWRV